MGRQPWRDIPQLRAVVWVAPCIAAWSLIPRLASNPGNLDAFAFLFWSNAVSASCLLLCTRVTGHWQTLRAYSTTDLRRLAALAALGSFGYCELLYSTYAPCARGGCPEPGAIAVITHYTWPALTVVWSAVLLRERLTRRMVASLLLGILAVAIGATGGAVPGDGLSKLPLVFVAAVVFGLYSTLLKRVAYEPYSSMAVGFTVATFLSLLALAHFSTGFALPDPAAVRAVLVNGIFVNGLSYVCWYRALHTAPIGVVAPWIALTPVLAGVFAGSSIQFEAHHTIGIGLVLVSALLAAFESGGPAGRCEPRSPTSVRPGRGIPVRLANRP